MSQWFAVANVSDFAPYSVRSVTVNNQRIVIVNLDGQFYALDDLCSHDHAYLSDGWLNDNQLVCPRHGAHFSVETGEALTPPAYEPVATYPVQIVDGKVQVQMD